MSGICGICRPDAEIPRAQLAAMLASFALPDETACEGFAGKSAALGVSRRWSFQQTGTALGVHVAADADLTNLAELAAVLGGAGSSRGDLPLAEVIARLYLREGAEFVERLEGAFSIAVWDERAQQLLLAVDRFGFKTLYCARERAGLLFAARVGAIREAQEAPGELDPTAILQYLLFSAIPFPLSVYRGIERLGPGHLLIFKDGIMTTRRYWDIQYEEDRSRPEQEWSRDLRGEMRAAVHRHLDGCDAQTTGAYLSGGTDSSSVVAFLSERCKPARTFSIAFPMEGYNEIGFAHTTAEAFSTRHHERCLAPEDAVAAIPKLVAYYDEPFANSSAIASYHCALLARENGVGTLLAGDGGDELFGGNERYASDRRFALYHSVPRWLRRGLIEPLARCLPANDGRLSLPRRYVQRARISNPRRILSYNFFLSHEPSDVFEGDFLAITPASSWLHIAEEHFRSARASSELNRLLYLDVKMTLADNDLRKVTGTAELAGVRVRYPLLDTRLAELSGRIPAKLKLKGMEKRYIFKQAMKDILPRKVLYKKKHGFGVPLGQWLLTDVRLKSLAADVLSDPRTRQRGYFRPGFLDKLLRLHQQGYAGFYGEVVWYLLSLELWHREHCETRREVSLAR